MTSTSSSPFPVTNHRFNVLRAVVGRDATRHQAILRQLLHEGDKMLGMVLQAAAAHAEYVGKQISERTQRALTEKKATGFKLSNPTNLPEAQKAGSQKNAERARKKAEIIADIISRTPNVAEMTASEIASLLNSSGCLSGRGKPWTVSGIRRPLKEAREIIEGREEQQNMDDPLFGMF